MKHSKGYTTQQLTTLCQRGEAVFADPITITHEIVIVEGYALLQLAMLQRRTSLTCVVRYMDHETATLHLLEKNRSSKGIGDFARILMALELEPWFRRPKPTKTPAEDVRVRHSWRKADRLDVRIEVARAAGVSAGNVSKVKQIQHSAVPQIREALLAGEIQINRAAMWSGIAPSLQERRLSDYRNERGVRRRSPYFCGSIRTAIPTSAKVFTRCNEGCAGPVRPKLELLFQAS